MIPQAHLKPTYNYDKAALLRLAAHSVLDNPAHRAELQALMHRLKLSTEDLLETYIAYDMDLLSYGNEIYNSLEIRMIIYMHYLLENSWHIERQKTIEDLISLAQPQKMIDLGFGVPMEYVRKLTKHKGFKLTLCDYAPHALTFAENILTLWSQEWGSNITLLHQDMTRIEEVIGTYDLYLFPDSIEHVENPSECLKGYVQQSKPDAKFILSLPIGPKIPQHFIEWTSVDDAIDWLKQCGLKILESSIVRVNPAVDLFADVLHFNLYNFICITTKARHP